MDAKSGTDQLHPAHEDARDRQLLDQVAQGDRAALETLYRSHHQRLAGFLHRNTSQDDLVPEIINETFWVVWRNAARFRGDSRVSTWIVGIAYRCMLKALRGRDTPTRRAADDALEQLPEETNHDERRELHDWIAHGLAQLPDKQRTALELAYFYGRSCNEIAAIMSCAPGTVKAWLFHARTRLRNVLPGLAGDNDRAVDRLPNRTR